MNDAKRKKSLYTKKLKAYMQHFKEILIGLGTYREELDDAIREISENRTLRDLNKLEWAETGYSMVDARGNRSQYMMIYQQLDEKALKWYKELGLTAYSMDKLGVLEKDETDRLSALLDDE